MSVRQFVNDWLERKTPEVAETTVRFYRNASDKFLEFLGPAVDEDLTQVTRDHLTKFRNQEAKRLAPKTVNHEVKFLRMLFRSAKRDALLADDPAEFVDTIRKGNTTARRPFTIGEIKAVLGVADPDWRSMVMFGLYTGQRLGDIATMTWQNIDLDHGEIRLITRKTRKTLILPIAAPLQRHIETMPSSDDSADPLHPGAFSIVSAQGKSGHLSNQFADLLTNAGLREKKKHRRNVAGKNGRGRGAAPAA
jgi:integrase